MKERLRRDILLVPVSSRTPFPGRAAQDGYPAWRTNRSVPGLTDPCGSGPRRCWRDTTQADFVRRPCACLFPIRRKRETLAGECVKFGRTWNGKRHVRRNRMILQWQIGHTGLARRRRPDGIERWLGAATPCEGKFPHASPGVLDVCAGAAVTPARCRLRRAARGTRPRRRETVHPRWRSGCRT